MKKHMILAAIAATALCTSCSNEDDLPVQGKEINFTINKLVSTRATTTDNTTTFDNDDIITIYSSGLFEKEMEGAKYKVNSTNLVADESNTTIYHFNGTKEATFYAFYPQSAISDATSAAVTIEDDQSNENFNFETYDLMTSTTKKGNVSTVPLEAFKHRLALVKVDASAMNTTHTINSITINNVLPTATWTFSSDNMTTSGTAINVTMKKESDGNYIAIIPAQKLAGNVIAIEATDNNRLNHVYYYTPSSEVEFAAGTSNKITLKLSGYQQVSATITSTSDWTETDKGTSDLEERQLVLISESQGTFSAANPGPTSKVPFDANIAENEWYFCTNGTSTDWKYDSTNNGFSVISENKSGWYNTHLGFRLSKELIQQSYGKRFLVKCTFSVPENQLTGLRIGVMQINKAAYDGASGEGYHHFQIDAYRGYKTFNTAGNCECTIDFNYLSTTDQDSKFPETPNANSESDYDDVVLYFAAGTINTAATYYVNNITVKEILE